MKRLTDHFNGLTEAEAERLTILIEECGEVVQAACKILRHGYESTNPTVTNGETNRTALERELGDMAHAMTRMANADDINPWEVERRRLSKPAKILPYLHHQDALAGEEVPRG